MGAIQSKIQICVKIDIKYLLVAYLLIILLPNTLVFAHSVDNYPNLDDHNKQITSNLGAGVNLSALEHTWKPTEELLKTDVISKIQSIKKDGFKTVRLPVAFDMFLQPNSSNFYTELVDKLGSIYNVCNSLHINLIITYHYGKVYYGSDNRFSERDRIMWMWKQLQNKFRGMGYDNLYFELYNEPTEERSAWKEDINYIIKGLRWEDKNRFYIVGGTNYNNADELLDLGKLDDDKILYTIHFYEPYIFTHQGAEWTKEKTYLTGIPYPYNKKKMPSLGKDAIGSTIEQDYTKYPAEGTKEYLLVRLRRIVEECKKRNMPLICTEAGVINTAENKYRVQYLEDITSIMIELNIPTMLWDYDQKFSIIDNGKPLKQIKKWIKTANQISYN